ncbi:MAG: DUF6076 domain-containing protein [Neglectibacter sp.]
MERGITVRRCKNCGRWFPQTGRVSAEYCERPVAWPADLPGGRGLQQWTKSSPMIRCSGLPEGVQALRLDQGRPYYRRAVLCLERQARE